MPYKIEKVKGKSCYKVIAVKSGRLMAKCTTKIKAKAQIKFLYMVDAQKKKVKTIKARKRLQRKKIKDKNKINK